MRKNRWVAAGAMALAVVSCLKMPQEDRARNRPKTAVQLPARPDLSSPAVPDRFPDGAYTVAGFLKHAGEVYASGPDHRSAQVRGYVQNVVRCPPETSVCATVPHLVLTDSLMNSRWRLIVVSDPPDAILADAEVGTQKTFQGEAALWSPNGRLMDLQGLLVVRKPPEPSESNAASNAR